MIPRSTIKYLWKKYYKYLPGLLIPLLLTGITQTLILLIFGPIITTLFESTNSNDVLKIAQIIPYNIINSFRLSNTTISRNELLYLIPSLLVTLALIKSIATYIYQRKLSWLILQSTATIRNQLFTNIISTPYQRLIKTPAGRWMSIIMNDVNFFQTRSSEFLHCVLHDSVIIIAALITLVIVNWQLAVIITITTPLTGYILGFFADRISQLAVYFQKELSNISSYILNMRQRLEFIRAQGGEEYEITAFNKINQHFFSLMCKSFTIRVGFAPTLELVGYIIFVISLLILVNKNHKVDDVIIYIAAISSVIKPLKNFGEQFARVKETIGAMNNVKKFLSVESKPTNSPKQPKLCLTQYLVLKRFKSEWEKGYGCYGENLLLSAGKTVAIVGKSGTGKSTFIKTCAGLLPPSEWHSSLPWQRLVHNTSLVSQKLFFFKDTVLKNITYGLDNPNLQQILATLSLVVMDDEIIGFKQKLSTIIDPTALNISGGQLQRLIIARALLQSKPILLLDEATSALDASLEARVISNLLEHTKKNNIMLLAVTHKNHLLSKFDEVWHVNAGKITNISSSRNI